jgi:hypothetical protein
MRTTRLRTRRDGQTVSWSEKTLPELGRLRNHFRFEEAGQFDCHPERGAFCLATSLSRACRGNPGEPRDVLQPALSEAEGSFATQ